MTLKKKMTPAETRALLMPIFPPPFRAERGVDFVTGEGKKFIYGAVNPPVTQEDGSEKKNCWNCYSA